MKQFLRDFLNFWTWQRQKRNKSARLPHFFKLTTSKTKQFCETSFKNGKLSAELTASCQCVLCFFPECVARVPVSLWGSGGWGCVRSTLRPRPQPSATVRNRSQPSARSPYGRAYGKFCRGGHFWRFQTCRCFVSRGRRGTSWHSDVFCNVLKIVLRGRRNTFVTFSEDVFQFSWQAQHFGRVHRHFSWQAQHFRQCCVFFANRIGRAASSGDKVQIPWQAWHFVTCAENWRKPRTKHRFWGCKFSGSKENSWENVDFEATKCENWRKSRTKCSFWCSHLSRLASLVFLWPRRVYGGSCKTCPFVMLPTVKIGGSLVRNAGFWACTCLVSSRCFSCGVAVSMGEAGKPVLFECFQAGCHAVLRGRRGTFWHSNLFDDVHKISKLEEVS